MGSHPVIFIRTDANQKIASGHMMRCLTIAEELRMQEVRRTDISTPPLFVIKNRQGQEMFFITRKALNEYIECNKKSLSENKTIIEIPSNNSYELEKLIEIIKRNRGED